MARSSNDTAPGDGPRVAVVTGGNRGLGLETCRGLAKLGLQAVLTSRDPAKAEEAAGTLESEGLAVVHHQLDVNDPESVERLAGFLRESLGRVDALVNNAGVLPQSAEAADSVIDIPIEILRDTIETNVFGALSISQALVPMMRERNYGRVVNVSSGLGQLVEMSSGWPAYRISKTALNALTRILASELDGTNILVNAVCPGWVRTGTGGPEATRDVAEGVDTILWLATLPDGGPSGVFFRDREPIPW